MKKLIGLLLVLFISSQTYADHHIEDSSPTKENICEHANTEMKSAYRSYRSSFLSKLDIISKPTAQNEADKAELNRLEKIYNEQREKLLIYSTIYKNLDCSEVAPLRKLL
jgi:hypothetical protein